MARARVKEVAALILRCGVRVAGNEGVPVTEYHTGVRTVDSKRQGLLAPGLHYFRRFLHDLKVETVNLRV